MDILQQELIKARQALAQDVGGKRVFRRSEIEQVRIQKLREEEKRELDARKSQNRSSLSSTLDSSSSKRNTTSASSSKTPTDDLNNVPTQEVIRRLRVLNQPITLFGEDDDARLDRLKRVLKEGCLELDSDMTEGQTNDFLRDVVELKKRQKSGMTKRKRSEEGGDDDLKRMRSNFTELCNEDKIIAFFKSLLCEWEQELNENPDDAQTQGKANQCGRDLYPLFKYCREKVLPQDMCRALGVMVDCCMRRDYLAAADQYIKLAIGNAAWPIGVTMVGIHERSAREKISTTSVAHIMNNETTRKYLQSIKRLMTFCQRRYPTIPSKSVEFNSLANGSDLQSLKAQEKNEMLPDPKECQKLICVG